MLQESGSIDRELAAAGLLDLRKFGSLRSLARTDGRLAPQIVRVGRLQRSDCGRNELFDAFSHVRAIGLPAGKARDALWIDEGVVQRSQQELTSPNDRCTGQMRQTLLDGIDERVCR